MFKAQQHEAFIISPMGKPGSRQRRHADWVRDKIIEPALAHVQKQGRIVACKRSDDLLKSGRITDQVIERIVEDRLLFCVLAENRPNCYFELGLAKAAGRPVVMLKHKGEKIQFDTADYRIHLEYELPTDLSSPACAEQIETVAEAIYDALNRSKHDDRVHQHYDPLGKNFSEWQMVSKFRDISFEEYSKFFAKAGKFITLQGITLGHFADRNFRKYVTPDSHEVCFFDFLRMKILADGCDVHIVMMHEDNETLPHLHKRHVKPTRSTDHAFLSDIEDTRDKIRASYRAWSRFRDEIEAAAPLTADGRKGRLDITKLRHGVVHNRLSITDNEVIISPYFNVFGGINGAGPSIRAGAMTDLYKAIDQETTDVILQNRAMEERTEEPPAIQA